MMTCRELVEQLLDFISDELGPEHRACICEHLCSCPPCEVLVQTYRITIRLSRQLPRAPLPAGLQERLRAALRQFGQAPG
jgi:anti-sigma factor RsiW